MFRVNADDGVVEGAIESSASMWDVNTNMRTQLVVYRLVLGLLATPPLRAQDDQSSDMASEIAHQCRTTGCNT